jgi:hypothetical protein
MEHDLSGWKLARVRRESPSPLRERVGVRV